MTQIPLMQQGIDTLIDVVEQYMNIGAMEGYSRSLRVTIHPSDANLVQLQAKILVLTEKIQELTIPRLGQPQVWCNGCYIEGHLVNECPWMRRMGPP